MLLVDYMYLPAGPTKVPKNIEIVFITANKLIFSWNSIPCSDQNGEILYYVVKYLYKVVSEGVQEQESQTDGNERGIILRNLRSNTKYNVTIAGVNSAGVGVFSLPVVATTYGGKHYRNLDMSCSHGMTTRSLLFFTNQLVRVVLQSNHSSPLLAA